MPYSERDMAGRLGSRLCVAVVALVAVFMLFGAHSAPAQAASIVVQLPDDGATGGPSDLVSWLGDPVVRVTGEIPSLHLYRLDLPDSVPPEHLWRGLEAQNAGWVQAEGTETAEVLPDDPGYGSQWWVSGIDLPAAWDLVPGGRETTVAVVDSGLAGSVPDLQGRIVDPYSVVGRSSASSAWQDHEGHGTAVAAIIAALGGNGTGIAGVDWAARIMPVKVGDRGSFSDFDCSSGIVYAVDHGADVINMSWGSRTESRSLGEAIQYARDHGVILVAAAGNDGSAVNSPASDSNVIAVGATDARGNVTSFSSHGPEIDLAAPGSNITSLSTDGEPLAMSGTSFSSPMVSGVAALLVSLDPELSPVQVENILKETARDAGPSGFDSAFGSGILDAGAAVQRVVAASTTDTTLPAAPNGTPPATPAPVSGPFRDVSQQTPYYAAISDLASLGVVSGFEDGSFRPDRAVARQQLAKMIVLALGYPVSEADVSPFADVDTVSGDLYPDNYVAVAAERGVTLGTGPSIFSPWTNVSRAQLVTMVARAAALADPPSAYAPSFDDFSDTHFPWARRAAFAGLLDGMNGMGPSYDFWAPASRGEVCMLLYNLERR